MSEITTSFLNVIQLLNRIVVTGILVTAFSLVIYIGLYNRRSDIARNLAFVLACVIGTLLCDLLTQVSTTDTDLWLRLQWVGIAIIPAASLHLSDALLRATGDNSPLRRFAPKGLYAVGFVFVVLSLFTNLVAHSGITDENLPHLSPGSLFVVFTLYYFPTIVWATYNVIEARRRALTATSKRRLTYFALSFAAPALGLFPYLLPIGWPSQFPSLVAWFGIFLVNAAVGAAITFMGYTVSYFGASAPDRVIKRRLVKYLLRGPVLAVAVITALVISGRIEKWLNLPGTIIGFIAAATIILMAQLFIVTLQPMLDRVIAGEDSDEVKHLQQFGERLMTTSDRNQFLENILAALCDLLRARTAFVTMRPFGQETATAPAHQPLNVIIGISSDVLVESSELPVPPDAVRSAMSLKPSRILQSVNGNTPNELPSFEVAQDFIKWDGYWLIPLHTQDGSEVLGVMGLAARAPETELSGEEREGVALLVSQAARTLEDAIKQSRAFAALERLMPDADTMQRRMAQSAHPAAPTLADFEQLPPEVHDQLTQLVRDALSQYWGGPKLTDSPLMDLRVVSEAMKAENGNATKALRHVLSRAIERLKPDGTRSMTATEWLLYNIMEMKILQNMKVRDVARKLVMSESDLYRKQRAAFEEVARIVMEMEHETRVKELSGENQAGTS